MTDPSAVPASGDNAGNTDTTAVTGPGGRDDRTGSVTARKAHGVLLRSQGADTWKRRLSPFRRARHTVIAWMFLLIVLIPSSITAVYMAFIAQDQYHSAASFAVRKIDSGGGAMDLIGMFSQAPGAGSTLSDSYIVMDYILSDQMVREVDQAFDLAAIFGVRGLDYYYGMRENLPIEDLGDYWRRMVTVKFDNVSGILQLHVKTFDPRHSQAVAEFVVARGEALVNDLSATAREEMLKVARSEVLLAEDRLIAARSAVQDYRYSTRVIDPGAEVKSAAEIMAGLEKQRAQLQAELSAARVQMNEDAPRIRVLKNNIESIEKQIAQERLSYGGDISALPEQIRQFETLETEREFAERAYTGALASLEKARIDANGKQRYLATFIRPSLSEFAQYPERLLDTFLVFLASLFVWGIAVMAYYNIRDRS